MQYWNIRTEAALFVFLACAMVSSAQRTEVSPYSAYGLGELAEQNLVQQRVMGGISLTQVDAYQLVPSNPASYCNLRKTVFEVAMRAQFLEITSTKETRTQTNARLMGFAVGLPFGGGKWGAGFGLMPESSVGYQLIDSEPIPNETSNVDLEYSGQGGLNRAFIGLSREIWRSPLLDTIGIGHRLLVGASGNYLFGNISNIRKAVYPQGQGYFNTNATSELIVRDPVFDLSVQHSLFGKQRNGEKPKSWRFITGLFMELPGSVSARRSDLITTFLRGTSGVEFTRDTVSFVEGTRGELKLPPAFGIGLAFEWDRKWTLALEHRRRDWSQLSTTIENWDPANGLKERTSYAMGISWLPAGSDDRVFGKSFFQQTIYRAGLRYVNDYLVLGGQELSELGISFGTSFPVLRSMTRSRLTFGAELGSRGTLESELVKERYSELFIGISITPELREPWFKKRKIE